MNPFLKSLGLFVLAVTTLRASSNGQGIVDVISVYKGAARELHKLESRIEREIWKGQKENFLKHFSPLHEEDQKLLEGWFDKIQSLRRTNQMDSVLVELPVLGAVTDAVLVLNGRFDVYFSHKGSAFHRRFGWPPLLLKKYKGEWLFAQMESPPITEMLPPVAEITEAEARRARFEVRPSGELSAIQVKASFVITNPSSKPLSQIPIYLRYPLKLEEASFRGGGLKANIRFVRIQGQPIAQLLVPLDPELAPGDSLRLTFRYSASYRYHHLGRKPVGFTQDRGFVLWESGWYPRFSAGWVQIPYDMTIIVPKGQKALTSGRLIDHRSQDDTELYSYRLDVPEGPYFVWGDYRETQHQVGSIKLMVWTPTKDTLDPQPLVDLLEKASATLRQLLPPPKIDLLRLVAVTRYGGYGPMGNLLLQDAYFSAKEAENPKTLEFVAHELSHSWISSISSPSGDLKAFLSEGLATYLAAKAVEKLCSPEDAVQIWQKNQQGYQRVAYRAVAPMELTERIQYEDNAMFRAVAYNKGAYFFRELEVLVGEKKLFQALRETLLQHKGKTFTLEAFLHCLNKLTDQDLQGFWQWYLTSKNPPDYLIVPAYRDAPPGQIKVKNLGGISPVPFHIVAYGKSMRPLQRKELVLQTSESERIEFTPMDSIAHVAIDPEKRILQAESRNDVYPDYFLPEADVKEIQGLIRSLAKAVRERDVALLDSLLTTDTELLSADRRVRLLEGIKTGPELKVRQKGYVKVFSKGNGQAEATAQLVIETPSGWKPTIGNFRIVKEKGKWKAITFGIKVFGMELCSRRR